MSQMTSIANKSRKTPAASLRDKPEISDNVLWRRDGQDDQIIIVSKEALPLPLILNPSASWIFSLCNGKNTLEEIAQILCEESDAQDFTAVLEDVKGQVEYFLDKGIVEI